MQRMKSFCLISLCALFFLAPSVVHADDEGLAKRMWWDEEKPYLDDRPQGFLRSGMYATMGATGNMLGLDIGGGFRFPEFGYFGLAFNLETGSWKQSLEEDGYYRPLPFGLLLGHEFRVGAESELDLELFIAQDFSWRRLPEDGNSVWVIQPTLRYGMPVRMSTGGWSMWNRPIQTTNTIFLYAGPRFLPYGIDLVVGMALR